MLLGVARVTYADAKVGVDEIRDVAVVTPITDAAVAVDWEQAEPAGFSAAHLSRTPTEPGASFAEVPAAATRPKSYATWEKDFARWAAQTQSVELLRSARTKLVSAPGESERDFRIRLQTVLREGRDAARAKVRDKHASKLQALEDRLRKAEHAVAVQAEQASGAKVQAAVSVAATVFGALLGRKAVSASTLGRATTAARGASRIGRETQDVGRAKANADALRLQLDGQQAALEADLQDVASEWDGTTDTLDRVLVKPKRGGVSVQLVGLVWVPKA